MTDYTPSMDEVRSWFPHRDDREKFDLALAAHNRKIAAEVLREAAKELRRSCPPNMELRPDGNENPEAAAYVEGVREGHERLMARADRIEQGGES